MDITRLHQEVAAHLSAMQHEHPACAFFRGGMIRVISLAQALSAAGFPVDCLDLGPSDRRAAYDVLVLDSLHLPEMLSVQQGRAWKIRPHDNVSLIRGFSVMSRSDVGYVQSGYVVHISVETVDNAHVFSLAVTGTKS